MFGYFAGAAAASRVYVDALSRLARQAQLGTWGGSKDVGKFRNLLIIVVVVAKLFLASVSSSLSVAMCEMRINARQKKKKEEENRKEKQGQSHRVYLELRVHNAYAVHEELRRSS